MNAIQQDLLIALEKEDVDTLNALPFHEELPNEILTLASIPTNPSWSMPSVVQCFALLFNGYNWLQENNIEPNAFFDDVKVKRKNNELSSLSLSELRTALFALQRMYRDSWGEPEPDFVVAILDAIREKLA